MTNNINLINNSSYYDFSEKDILFKSVIYPFVEKSLKNKSTENKLINYIGRYRDRNIDILSSPMITKNMFFTPSDFNIVYDTIDIEESFIDELLGIVKPPEGCKKGLPDNVIPFLVLLMMIMRYYRINKNERYHNIITAYYAYSRYFSLHAKYFNFEINENVMKAVTNSLSYKNKIKQTGSLDKTLRHIIDTTMGTYSKRLIRGGDQDIMYIIQQIKTRLNNWINKMKNEYKIAMSKGDALFTERTFDEEDNIIENSGILSDVQSYASDATTKFFSTQEVDRKTVMFCAKGFNISANELRSSIILLAENNEIDEIKKFYDALFYLFFNNGGKKDDIGTKKFLGLANEIYKKGNSNDKNIKTIKTLLNKWLSNGSQTYVTSNRPGTLNSFRKAIFFYFVMIVSK